MAEIITLKPTEHLDNRGKLEKLLWNDCDWKIHLESVVEVFLTRSVKGCVRGLHFQNPPYSVNKVIKVISGSIFEVVVDLRRASPNFGVVRTFELKADEKGAESGMFIPRGFAHGYQAISEDTQVLYFMDGSFKQDFDSGINIDSFRIEWPIKQVIRSERDKKLQHLSDFESLFIYD